MRVSHCEYFEWVSQKYVHWKSARNEVLNQNSTPFRHTAGRIWHFNWVDVVRVNLFARQSMEKITNNPDGRWNYHVIYINNLQNAGVFHIFLVLFFKVALWRVVGSCAQQNKFAMNCRYLTAERFLIPFGFWYFCKEIAASICEQDFLIGFFFPLQWATWKTGQILLSKRLLCHAEVVLSPSVAF